MAIRQKHQIGCTCCGCNCLRWQEPTSPDYAYDIHVRFKTRAFGVHLGAVRDSVDNRIWKARSSIPSGGRATMLAARVPPGNAKPRILFHTDTSANVPTTLVFEDFDSLGARQGCLWECDGGVWTLLESNNFTYLGAITPAAGAFVDGVAMAPAPSTAAPDNAWCNPSYIPDSITAVFGNWDDDGVRLRSLFNGVAMALPLTNTTTFGGRQLLNYGRFALPLTPFYNQSPIFCGGGPAWPQDTLRWRVRCQVWRPIDPADGTATQIWVGIAEDVANVLDAGCYRNFSGDVNGSLSGVWKFLSSFDQTLDDQLGITHWIKKANTAAIVTFGVPAMPDDATYCTSVVPFSEPADPLGNLLRVIV